MKRSAFFLIVCFLMIANNMFAQQTASSPVTDSTGLPGDHFSLQGALEMFKQSKTPEDFEKKLNSKDNYVNNLDLNGDGKIDYVRVIDKTKGNAHALVLQVAVNRTESQDIAVIEIEKQGNQSAILQIVGDKELYGDSTYVEPVEAGAGKTKGAGPSASLTSVNLFFVNVWFWPCVTYIYEPVYVVYESPWYWDYYPYWWSPWSPMSWYWHHHYCYDYYYYGYRPVYVHRVTYAHDVYYGNRRTSTTVSNRYQDAHQQYQANRTSRIEKANYNNNAQGNYNNNTQGKYNNNSQGKYNNNVQGKPVNSNQGRVNNNIERNPANNQQGKANNFESKPGNSNQSKTNSYDNKPGNYNQGRNNNSYDNKPNNNYQSKPNNMNQGRNENNYQSKPNNNVQGKPGNNVQGKPSNNYKGQPSNGQKVQPSNSGRSDKPANSNVQKGNSTRSNQSGSHTKTNSVGKHR